MIMKNLVYFLIFAGLAMACSDDETPPPQPCAITALSAGTQTACDPGTNTYTQEVIVTHENAPASGTLDVNGQSFAISGSPQTVTLAGLTADGLTVDVTASFSADAACTSTEIGLFTAPADCTPNNFFVRVNSGGPSITYDFVVWEGDRDNNATGTFSSADPDLAIDGTENDELYRTEAFDLDRVGFTYELPVPNEGPWEIDLHFAEIFHGVENGNGTGSRVFDVDIENGQASLPGYDIIEKAGGAATAVVENFTDITVTDGNLTIIFTSVVDAAKISGIEISGIN
jgi:hypothetical protein